LSHKNFLAGPKNENFLAGPKNEADNLIRQPASFSSDRYSMAPKRDSKQEKSNE
jgi:hypothetical protein